MIIYEQIACNSPITRQKEEKNERKKNTEEYGINTHNTDINNFSKTVKF